MGHANQRKRTKGAPGFAPEIPPDHFERIGWVIAAWPHLEVTLHDLLWHFLDLDDEDGRTLTSRVDSKRLLGTLTNIASRHLAPERQEEFQLLFKAIGDLLDDRNFIAHGVWGSVGRIPAAVSLRLKSDPYHNVMETFPEIRMRSISDGIDEARRQIVALTTELQSLRERPAKPPLP